MRTTVIILACMVVTGVGLSGCGAGGSNSSKGKANLGHLADSINTQADSISYVLGKKTYQNMSRSLNRGGIEVNEKLVAKAIIDAANGNDTLINQTDEQAVMNAFKQKMRQQMRQRQKGQGMQQQGSGGGNRQQQMKEKLKEKLKKRRQQQQQQQQQQSPEGGQ